MSGLVDKVKDKVGGSSGPLQSGSKLPSVGVLKEYNPTEGSVDLSTLKGKSESSVISRITVSHAVLEILTEAVQMSLSPFLAPSVQPAPTKCLATSRMLSGSQQRACRASMLLL